MSNILKKIVAIVTALTVSVWVAGPGMAQAQTVEELQAQINALLAQLATLQAQLAALTGGAPTGVPAACTGITFERNLRQGMSGNDVKCLQALLNTDPETKVAETGAGSPGNETTFFGPKTKAAVVKFQEKYAAEILTPLGLTVGTGVVGPSTRAKLNALLTVPPPPEEVPPEEVPPAAGLTVELAADTPAASVLLGKQVRAPLLKVTFTNGDDKEGKVTELKIQRMGISTDGNLDAVYLLDENGNRIGDENVFINGEATFKDAAGLFVLAPGAKKSILVVGDVAADQAGYSIGVRLVDVKGIFTALNATFPISGNLMSIGPNLATKVEYDSDSGKGTTVSKQAGEKDVVVWKGKITPSASIKVFSIAFKGIGNIEPANLKNYRVYLAGSQVGLAVEMGSNYIVKVDVSDNPVSLTSGAKELKVIADVVGGTGRSVYFEIYPAEILMVDAETGVGVKLKAAPGGNADWSTIAITGASAQLTKAPDTPVSVATTTDALVAKFVLKALGERVKFTKFVATSSPATLDSAIIYVDGAKVTAATNIGTTATSISASPVFYVDAGSQVTIEVRADTTNYTASTIKLSLEVEGESKTVPSLKSNVAEVSLDVIPAVLEVSFAKVPDSFLAVAGKEELVAKYKFVAKGSPATIKTITFAKPDADVNGLKVVLGGENYSAIFKDGKWVVENINYSIGAGKIEIADVYLNLAYVSSATDGKNAATTLEKVAYSQAGQDLEKTVGASSNAVYVYKAVPIVTALTTGQKATLQKGIPTTVTLYQWKVKAVGGAINSTLGATTTIAFEKAGATATTTLTNFKVFKGLTEITGKLGITVSGTGAADTSGKVVIETISAYPDILEVLEGGEIELTLKADVTGGADASYIKAYLSGGATDYTWHDGLIAVTDKGNLVKGLPTEPYQQTVIK